MKSSFVPADSYMFRGIKVEYMTDDEWNVRVVEDKMDGKPYTVRFRAVVEVDRQGNERLQVEFGRGVEYVDHDPKLII